MSSPVVAVTGTALHAIRRALKERYRIPDASLARIHAGTATDNFVASDPDSGRWFVKVYRAGVDLQDEAAAIDLADFARAGDVPVPRVRRSVDGMALSVAPHGFAMSVWEFVEEATTAEGGLVGDLSVSAGLVIGRLHRRLANHPSAPRTVRPAADLVDFRRAAARYDRLITRFREDSLQSSFKAWALDAALERRALLRRAELLLGRLPALSVQIVHGDLAAPNVLVRAQQIAAIIDFQPPAPRHTSWEIARIACDPRSVVSNATWADSLAVFSEAYRDANPHVREADLTSVVAMGCAYTLASTYPLEVPFKTTGPIPSALEGYARARHEAALIMLDHLTL